MKKLIFVFPFMFVLFASLQAQDYKSSIGLRLGSPMSVSFKTFLGEESAFEVTAGTKGYNSRYDAYNYRWYSVSAAYQIHKPVNIDFDGMENLKYYYGAGASAYFWTWDYESGYSDDGFSTTTFGIQGYVGLEYTFENIPLNIAVDWVPTFFVNGFGNGFGAGYGGIALRYVLFQ
ncbi:MAG: hypothetical protein ACI8P3_003716 [Saprospiraceae bacterium]|jgi:hypothetical protein